MFLDLQSYKMSIKDAWKYSFWSNEQLGEALIKLTEDRMIKQATSQHFDVCVETIKIIGGQISLRK